jgi:hypothetical protein
MEAEGGVPHVLSYNYVIGKEHVSPHFNLPTFELSEGMKQLIWEEKMRKEKMMDIDPKTNQPKDKCTWEPDKCIPLLDHVVIDANGLII